ncbi:MAG: polysaccharide biosynthesis protein [Deltaproteobacteria bacterium]|nr:polysaccharide biosynthesis protein [Deltaproteobacteria bacterium]
MLRRLLNRNFLFILGMDVLLISAAWYFSYLLRFNFQIPPESINLMKRLLPLIVAIKIVTFFFCDLYRGMWRYTSIRDFFDIIRAASISSLIIVVLILYMHRFAGFARSVFIIDWVLTVSFISGYRLSIRIYFWLGSGDETARLSLKRFFRSNGSKREGRKNLLIIGAGDCGEKIFREIQDNARLRYHVVGFLDDDPRKVGMKIHGVPVVGRTEEIKHLAPKLDAEEVLIAIPSASGKQMREIIASCEQISLPFKTVPGMGELIDGKVSVKAIRDVAYRDLLGREVIRLDEDRIGSYLAGSRVLVTGAGGSIGSELCRQICRFNPSGVILYETAESALYEVDLELRESFPDIEVMAILADIRDRSQLSKAFSAYRPQVVFHAAAYKHVPMMEVHPWKAVRNNILGTRNVIDVSCGYGVERFVFVSTDKAVRPTSIMGASKRVAEMLVQSQNASGLTDAPFVIVRFGNVVGSVGSVVPLFRKQIEKGGPVTVTHPEVTRYFMTIPEACQLILQAGAMGEGGEIFILDMGTPIKIDDMARDLIRLSGFEPEVDIPIEYIGLRPGEKLYEELITEGEGIVPTSHEKIMVLRGETCDQAILNGKIDQLRELAYRQDGQGIREKLREIVAEYRPGGEGSMEVKQ